MIGVLQKSEVKNPECAGKSANLLKMKSVKGIFQEFFQRFVLLICRELFLRIPFFGFVFIFSYTLQAVKFILYSFCWILNNNVHKVISKVMINTSSFLNL